MFFDLFFSIVLFLAGIIILYKKEFSWKGMSVDMSDNYIYVFMGTGLIILGVLWLYTIYKNKV